MISYELKPPVDQSLPEELEIFLDKEGLKTLLAQLRLLYENKSDHVHMMTENWGAGELSNQLQDSKNSLIQHVKITILQLGEQTI